MTAPFRKYTLECLQGIDVMRTLGTYRANGVRKIPEADSCYLGVVELLAHDSKTIWSEPPVVRRIIVYGKVH